MINRTCKKKCLVCGCDFEGEVSLEAYCSMTCYLKRPVESDKSEIESLRSQLSTARGALGIIVQHGGGDVIPLQIVANNAILEIKKLRSEEVG